MGETMLSRSALQSVLDAGSAASCDRAGLTIRERRPLTIVQLGEIPGAASPRAEVETVLGMPLPPAGKSCAAGARWALWVGPSRWLLVEPGTSDLVVVLGEAAAGALAVTDLSHARTVLRLSGPNVVHVLAQGCAVDLHPRSIAAGDSIVAGIARHAAVLHVVDSSPAFDLYVHRSFAQDMIEWLVEAAAACGHHLTS